MLFCGKFIGDSHIVQTIRGKHL